MGFVARQQSPLSGGGYSPVVNGNACNAHTLGCWPAAFNTRRWNIPLSSPVELSFSYYPHAGNMLVLLQMTLASMVEVLLSLASKLDARERDLALSATHIKTLRRELSSACRRQLSEATVQLAKSVVADDEVRLGTISSPGNDDLRISSKAMSTEISQIFGVLLFSVLSVRLFHT